MHCSLLLYVVDVNHHTSTLYESEKEDSTNGYAAIFDTAHKYSSA